MGNTSATGLSISPARIYKAAGKLFLYAFCGCGLYSCVTSPIQQAQLLGPRNVEAPVINGFEFEHSGGAEFTLFIDYGDAVSSASEVVIDLRKVTHKRDPLADHDVPEFTDVTLIDVTPPLIDRTGREFALLTLYNVDPPLADLPSEEENVGRGLDYRDPANLVKSAYSNYVSPVFTDDEERLPVSSHPIGHFLVKLEIPGLPTLLTGMTTTERADDELVSLTLGGQLGIGGVLLTPQPGRLNSASEVYEELTLRQRPLVVIDGVNYRPFFGRNPGPTFSILDGNVTFARFKIPIVNAHDALAFFLEYLHRGTHNIFGSLINRPHKGTGAGCAAFAMAWLKAAGVIPLVDEAEIHDIAARDRASGLGTFPYWPSFYRQVRMPWPHIGCDERVGADQAYSADYTALDLLLYGESDMKIIRAAAGLAEKLKEDIGTLGATFFRFGAYTPLRDFVLISRRKDPNDEGDYGWADDPDGMSVSFWDNRLFANWIKDLWRAGAAPAGITLVKEGRFLGAEVDAMSTPRQAYRFFDAANDIVRRRRAVEASGPMPLQCRQVFALGLQ